MSKRISLIIISLMWIVFLLSSGSVISIALDTKSTVTAIITSISTKGATPTKTLTPTSTSSPTVTTTLLPTNTVIPSITPTAGSMEITPYPSAPYCLSHDNSEFHTLWDSIHGCFYDHEHGTNPFTQDVMNVFPDFNLFELLGNVQIGSTNPSSSMENTHKHGGMKWDVVLSIPCEIFESAQWCVTDAAVQYHAFGDYSIEMDTRIHSTVALIKACNPSNVNDCGFLFTVQHQDYGQRVSQYQGDVVPYPNNPVPAYDKAFGPYFTVDRYGSCVGCRPSLAYVSERNINANSIWTSEPTGQGIRPDGSTLFTLLFRVRDTYQLLDWASVSNGYPFTFGWVCGVSAYNPVGCRYNNTTTKVHEVSGIIPASWDNLSGFDTNPVIGRITAEGYTDRFGTLMTSCVVAGGDCFPIKMVNMFVGKYGGALPGSKVSNPTPISNPSRNIWFCNGTVCNETVPGAIPSGKVGSNN